MSQSGSWVPKGIDQRARDAAREAAISEGLTLGEYLDRLMNPPERPQPNEISAVPDRRPPADTTSEALEKLTRRIEATEARSAMAITSMDHTIHDLVDRLENTQQTTAAIAGHVDGMIDQLRDTHDALKQKVRRLEEDETQQDNLEALKALESALGKLASHVYEENELAEQETQAIKGRVESGFMDIIERVESIETRVTSGLEAASQQAKEGVEQATLRTASATRQISERMSTLESGVNERLARVERNEERLDATDTRLETIETDVSGALDSMEITLDCIQDRLNRAETTTDAALKNLETTFSSLDERIDEVASKIDPDLADRLRSEFEARFEDMMTSVRQTVDTVRQELAEEINRAAETSAEAAVSEVKETLTGLSERLEAGEIRVQSAEDRLAASEDRLTANEERLTAGEERQAEAIEKVSGQVTQLTENFDTRLQEVEERSDSAASEAVREEIDRLGKTVSERIDELAGDLSQRVADSETRSAEAIEQIGDQVAAATNRLQMRQNEAIKTLAEQVDENRRKADARLSDALTSVSERLERMQTQASESLSPVQKAIASLAARLESLEDITSPPFAEDEGNVFAAEPERIADPSLMESEDDPLTDVSFDDFAPFENFDLPETVAAFEAALAEPPVETAPELSNEPDAEGLVTDEAETEPADDDGVSFEAVEDYSEATPEDLSDSETEEFEAGIESWDTLSETDAGSVDEAEEDSVAEDSDVSFEDDFDAIRAAVEGLSFAHQDSFGSESPDDDDKAGLAEPEALEAVTDAPADTPEATEEVDEPETELAASPESEPEGSASEDDTFPDPLDALDGLDEAHTETRESDIFDDEEFEVMELPAAAEVPQPEADKALDADTADYLTRARKAAMSSNFGKVGGISARTVSRPAAYVASSGGASRLPLIAAVSAVAVAGVAAGGYLFLRGKQDTPVQQTPANTYVDPGMATPDTQASTTAGAALLPDAQAGTAIDDDLFDEAAPPAESPLTASYAPVPSVVTVEAAAAAGNYIAQYQLGQDKLARGDFSGGAELMQKAARKGLPIAQYTLAKLHEKGTGVPKDLTLAREWTAKAARGGNVKAMHDLAVFMAEGDGGEQTYAGAVEWFRKGAEYGVVDSQYNLGVLYEQGLGISPNLTESLFWFDVANRNGDGGASARIADLIERVSPEAAAQARSRAANWQAAPANAIANGRFGAQIWNLGNPLQVQAVQKALTALGYDVGVADGILGSGTAQAIREYQAANRLAVTGSVTPSLIETLNAGATPE